MNLTHHNPMDQMIQSGIFAEPISEILSFVYVFMQGIPGCWRYNAKVLILFSASVAQQPTTGQQFQRSRASGHNLTNTMAERNSS